MKQLMKCLSLIIKSEEEYIRSNAAPQGSEVSFYHDSIHKIDGAVIAMARDRHSKFILVIAGSSQGVITVFDGEQIGDSGIFAKKCPLNAHNAETLRKLFPWTAPISLRGRKTTVGCGDRLGLASVGHIAAAKHFAVAPVLAQQSMRELDLTGRTYRQVVDDATFMVFQAAYKDGFGADGDHLKNIADIDVALAAGMPMITLDLSEVMLAKAGDWPDADVEAAFNALPPATQRRINHDYTGKTIQVGTHQIHFDAATARRCAVMYLKALDFALEVYQHIKAKRGDKFDLEISIDETTSPTLPSHHLFIVRELRLREVEFTSLAPRFIGEFQKAIDYIGDLAEFERQFAVHAAIAKSYGDYKVSIHSGSDKFMVYPAIGAMTGMRLHLKTAGTSWLEAVRVIAINDPVLYRVIHQCAQENFKDMLRLYHITADITKIPPVNTLSDEELPALLEMKEARQMLHITYGPILKDKTIRPLFFEAMHKFEQQYHELICAHFEKHLSLLGVPKIH
jgi:hypothetical protein